jgi:phenylalanyl-tRNA synthetase beta chain
MRAPLSWIQEFTPVDAPVDDIVTALNQLGLEVEAVDEPGREIDGVVVAEVLDVVAHPNADKLSLVDINFGSGTTRVVCGAPNVVAGMYVPYAGAGSTLPGGLRLERRKIRGETSDGMLCSAAELGLGDDHGGILSVDPAIPLGSDARQALGLDDVVFDLAITPNRPDAMCVVGIARELAAHFGLALHIPEPGVTPDSSLQGGVSVTIEAPERCPRYVAGVAAVTLGASPAWMQQRLIKAGMRPISNVVDVTNYVLLERNQPLHAFDLGSLAGRGVIVRLAKPGEPMTTLDGVDRTLDAEDLVICDAESTPQAIAGIMGGSSAEVSDDTTEILLESAYFERMGIAKSSKRLRLRSESSARFERGIDPEATVDSAARAMELLAIVAAARIAREVVDEYPRPFERPHITVRAAKINAVLGTKLEPSDVLDALRPLGIDIDSDDGADEYVAVPPSFRPDLDREIDLVEEVARRIGFGAIGRTVARPRDQVGALTPHQRARRQVADALVGAGLSEAVTLPLVAPTDLERAGAPVDRLVLALNPLRAEESALRTRILPGLLRAVVGNQVRGLMNVALFESGRIFLAPEQGVLPDEPTHVAAVLAGQVRRAPVEPDREIDGYDAIDVVRVVLDALEIDTVMVAARSPGFQNGRAVTIEAEGVAVGVAGEIAIDVRNALGIQGNAVGFELNLDLLLDATRRDRSYVGPSPYPPASVDLAFVVGDDVAAAAIETTLRATAPDLLEHVGLFDEFRSDALGAGRRSLAFGLRYRAPDRTLTVEEVAGLRQQAIDAVQQAHGAQVRS